MTLARWMSFSLITFSVACSGGKVDGSEFTVIDDSGSQAESEVIVDPFEGAPDFAGGSARRASIVSKHIFEGVGDPTGKDCFGSGCHGSPGTPRIHFGGTVYTDDTATKGAVGAEIRVLDANGTAWTAFSDQQGNFYVGGTGTLAFPAHAAVRNADGKLIMEGALEKPSCNESKCHDGQEQAFVFAPTP